VGKNKIDLPLISIVMGSEDRTAPTLGIFGGVHGLERIGSEVVIAFLQTLAETLKWDRTLQGRFEKSRIVFMPIVNPAGMFTTNRSNANGIDLMRNAPVQADEKPPFLLGGQRISNKLPWFMGHVTQHEQMEKESLAICQLFEEEMFHSKCSFALDVHSGFGVRDQLWFPYARTRRAAPHLAEFMALKNLFDKTYPNHFYKIEPQAKNYTTHGDIWDYLYDRHRAAQVSQNTQNLFIPWTLELGSWMWLKKNPRQLFSILGAFNPVRPHRLKRTLRRHLTLFDFLQRALISPVWAELGASDRENLRREAMGIWYE
jgi:hypothetical protein